MLLSRASGHERENACKKYSEYWKELNEAMNEEVLKRSSGRQARSKAKDSRSFPVGVRRFKSCPLHHKSEFFK
jgi:hypothetical protein